MQALESKVCCSPRIDMFQMHDRLVFVLLISTVDTNIRGYE